MRADLFLVRNNYVKSRPRAKAIIEAGGVLYNGRPLKKVSEDIPDGANIEITVEDIPFVSRGGLKLKAALEGFSISPENAVCVDIGSSTGGFCDCLLQNGAKKIYAFDVGRDQLDETLRKNEKIVLRESFDARNIEKNLFSEKIDLVTMDVSFISQTLIFPAISKILDENGIFISLIKPQFEAGRENIAKGGIVKSEKARSEAVEKVVNLAKEYKLCLKSIIPSPILGGDGNTEFLAHFVKTNE